MTPAGAESTNTSTLKRVNPMWNEMNKLPKFIWVLLFGVFVTRGSFYMVWPYISIILIQKHHLSASEVGTFLSIAGIISVCLGLIVGVISDFIGRKLILLLSGILNIIAFCMLAVFDSVWGYLIAIGLSSIGRAMWEPTISALFGDIIHDKNKREFAFHIRYFAINIGSAIGPLTGVWLSIEGEPSNFFITAFSYLIFLIAMCLCWMNAPQEENIKSEKIHHSRQPPLREIFKSLWHDKLLLLIIISNIIILFIYGQQDSTLIQYLTIENADNLMSLVSMMVAANSFVTIAFQFIFMKKLASLSIHLKMIIGIVFFAFAQILCAYNSVTMYWGWIAVAVTMSFGQTIIFPLMTIQIDNIAPAHLKGTYYGAAALNALGYVCAPYIGGIMLDHWGGPAVFQIMSGLCGLVILLFICLDKKQRATIAVQPSQV
ncbi:MFS transporter [Photobacterium sp. 53610]|uniref:MFS transporter n=1 Tax=Photobacterium sp. 53610 TaxID=3102789 RepID=UPI002EDA50AF